MVKEVRCPGWVFHMRCALTTAEWGVDRGGDRFWGFRERAGGQGHLVGERRIPSRGVISHGSSFELTTLRVPNRALTNSDVLRNIAFGCRLSREPRLWLRTRTRWKGGE